MNEKKKPSSKQEDVTETDVLETSDVETEDVPKSALDKLREELEKQNDLLLRTAAEYDNFRKRTKREKETFFSDAKAHTLSALLPFFDNLDRAMAAADSDPAEYRKGVEMVSGQLSEILTGLGVEEIGKEGEPFDPEKHSAVSREEKPDAPENTLAQVFQKGYSVDGKIIRHAVVSVYN